MNRYLRLNNGRMTLSPKFEEFLKRVVKDNGFSSDYELKEKGLPLKDILYSIETNIYLLMEEARHQVDVFRWQVERDAEKTFNKIQSSNNIQHVDGIENILKDAVNHKAFYTGGSDKTYLLLQKDTGFVKIGKSNNPIRRIKEVQMPNVRLVGYLDYNCEHYLHDSFEKNRIDGEWFLFKKKDLDTLIKFFSRFKK